MRIVLRKRWVAGVAVVLLAALVLGIGVLAGRGLAPDVPPATSAPTTTPTGPAVPEGFVSFHDERTGVSIAYPKSWTRVSFPDPQVRLVATPNRRDYVQVRVIPGGGLPSPRPLTRSIKNASKSVRLLQEPSQIELRELAGYWYLYSFLDSRSRQRGVHSHYFLSNGEDTIVLVFQALPQRRFLELGPLFDQIANTLRAPPS